ncbi:MAG: hypothetical protein ACYDCK_13440 [Thermoplasmatota archaeon]
MAETSWTRAGIVALLAAAAVRVVGEFGALQGRSAAPPLLYLDGALVFVALIALVLGRAEYGARHRGAVGAAALLFALSFLAAAFGRLGIALSFGAGALVGVVGLAALAGRLARIVLLVSLVGLIAPFVPALAGVALAGDLLFALGAWMTFRTLPPPGGERAANRGLV